MKKIKKQLKNNICDICGKEHQRNSRWCCKNCYQQSNQYKLIQKEYRKTHKEEAVKYNEEYRKTEVYLNNNSYEKRKPYFDEHSKTIEFKTSQKKYRQSKKGRDKDRKYKLSDKGKIARKKQITNQSISLKTG